MDIQYVERLPDERDYFSLFSTTGWHKVYEIDAEELMASLRGSWFAISAFEGEKLVGFRRRPGDAPGMILRQNAPPQSADSGRRDG